MLSHIDLASYYRIIFAMTNTHNYAISDVENLMPFERDIICDLLIEFMQKQKESLNE